MTNKTAPNKLLVIRDIILDMQALCSWMQGSLKSQTARVHLDKAQGLLLRAASCIAEAAEKEDADGES